MQLASRVPLRRPLSSKHTARARQSCTENFIMENDNEEITFSLVECDLIPNGRGTEASLTLAHIYVP